MLVLHIRKSKSSKCINVIHNNIRRGVVGELVSHCKEAFEVVDIHMVEILLHMPYKDSSYVESAVLVAAVDIHTYWSLLADDTLAAKVVLVLLTVQIRIQTRFHLLSGHMDQILLWIEMIAFAAFLQQGSCRGKYFS